MSVVAVFAASTICVTPNPVTDPVAGLYVHIPFCRAKCAYCDFYSGPLRGFSPEEYVAALQRELDARRGEVGEFATVYIGGGTPSTMPPALLAPFLELAPGERTVEVNPEDVTPGFARELRAAGANRVSMGVQSLVDSELAAIGRRHTAARAVEAFETLRNAGFDNISLDLIYGLPGQTADTWKRSLHGLLDLAPEHLSAYLLSYEPGTLLHTRLAAGRIAEAPEELVDEMYTLLCDSTRSAGMEHYEISNFARPGLHARHNSSYWDMTPYIGLGPGAHSFDGKVRRANPASLKEYMAAPTSAFVTEEENDNERHNDLVMTALRTARGIDPSALNTEELAAARRILEPAPGGRLRIPEQDWLLSNTLLEPFIRI